MIKRFVNFIKFDFNSVKCVIKYFSNNRIPTWVIVLYYCMLAPFLLPLYFPIKWIIDRRIKKMLDEISKES